MEKYRRECKADALRILTGRFLLTKYFMVTLNLNYSNLQVKALRKEKALGNYV